MPWRYVLWTAFIAVVVGLGVYCGNLDDAPYRRTWSGPPVDWTFTPFSGRDDGVQEYDGHEHCGWQHVRFLEVPVPVIRAAGLTTDETTYQTYARRAVQSVTIEVPDLSGTLPAEAIRTEYHLGDRWLWLAPGEVDRAVYVKRGSRAERWVRFRAGCD